MKPPSKTALFEAAKARDPRGRDAVDIARARRLPRDMIERLAALAQRRR